MLAVHRPLTPKEASMSTHSDTWNGPTPAQMDQLGHLPLDGESPLCTCPELARGPWDCLDCSEHGQQAADECAAEQQAEIDAENAWLRAAENAMEDCPEWAR